MCPIRRHERAHLILGIHERTQRRNVDGLIHQQRFMAKEASCQSAQFTQSVYLRAKHGEGLELICNTRNL